MKALLHGIGGGPWGHDLTRLGSDVDAAGVEVPSPLSDALARLSRHYIPARYPDAHPGGPAASHYRASDAAEAIADAERVLAFVDERWNALRG